MITPSNSSPLKQDSWAVVITYSDDGHVSDREADKIDYDQMMKDMQESSVESNKERKEQGYEPVEMIGWAAKPYYDKGTHKLYWAKELKFGEQKENTLNYNIRVLGRKGVLVLNAVAGMNQFSKIKDDMKTIENFTDFTKGNGYSDFNASSDKMAAYGIAALVAGGVAAKLGLFAKIGVILLAAKKFLIFAVLGIMAFFKGLFNKQKKEA
jgi:uncharacterized membrane-anchored protein